MKRTTILTAIAILILSTVASAQFKIKIPKIKTPKIPKVNKDIKETVNSNAASAKGKNRQMVIDDGFTFFKAEPVQSERIEKYNGYIAKGWTLEGHFRVFGTFPDNSNMKMVVVKNGKALATYYCTTKLLNKTTTSDPWIKNSPADDYMATNTGNSCGGTPNAFVKEPGKYDVQVYVINGDNDEETLLRTYKIDVREAKKTSSRRHSRRFRFLYSTPRRSSGSDSAGSTVRVEQLYRR